MQFIDRLLQQLQPHRILPQLAIRHSRQICLEVVTKIAQGQQAYHARAALQRMQITL